MESMHILLLWWSKIERARWACRRVSRPVLLRREHMRQGIAEAWQGIEDQARSDEAGVEEEARKLLEQTPEKARKFPAESCHGPADGAVESCGKPGDDL